jgi:hypothetical protein
VSRARRFLFLFPHCLARPDALTSRMAWAEDRAPWRHDPSAVPGTKTERGGTMPPSLPFGIGTKAANRPTVIRRSLPYFATPVSPFHAEPLQ